MSDQPADILMACEPWSRALAIQRETMKTFHQTCASILEGNCRLDPLRPEQLSLEHNLFSTLFIMATDAAGVALDSLPFYAMVYQCLRVQVTGCDNLLDDEYKSVIPFALAGDGFRFRSVLTIMTGDAVLARMVINEVSAGRMDHATAQKLLAAALAVLIPSGIEEHEEESRLAKSIPTIKTILQQIHPRKTGLLFEAPIRLVEKMRVTDPSRSTPVAEALADFGIACQILDDLKDVADDLYHHRHNLVISQAFHGNNELERKQVADCPQEEFSYAQARRIAGQLVIARENSLHKAIEYFQRAEQAFTRCFPVFGSLQAASLGILVQHSIMAERNDQLLREEP